MPLKALSGRMRDISEGEGDLTAEIATKAKDETGMLASFFNRFVTKIRNVVKEVKVTSLRLITASDDMNSMATNLMENVRNQAASTEEISSVMDELSGGVDSIAENTNEQSEKLTLLIGQIEKLSAVIQKMNAGINMTMKLSEEISADAKSGEDSIRLMTNSMTKITESSEKYQG